MNKHAILFISLCLTVSLWAKEAYNIKVKINGLPNTTIQLGYHYGEKQYVMQDAQTNGNGETVFKGDTALPTGVYLIVLPENRFFEFLVEEQFFSIEGDYSDEAIKIETLKAQKSAQNTRFFEHSVFLKQKADEANALKALLEVYNKTTAKKAEAEDINKKLIALDDEIQAYRAGIVKELKGKFLSKLLLASQRPVIPPSITNKTEQYNYYKAHFWDDYDFSCEGLLYSPTYTMRIKEYVDNLTVGHYDSVFQSVDYIIQRSKANKEVYKFTLIWALNEYAKTKTVCYDAVYVNIAQKYYATGQTDWVEKEQLEKIIDNANALAKVKCGQKASPIVPKSESYATPSLYKVPANYTVLFFWDADCGHCKKEAKDLKKLYQTYKDSGVVIYSVEIGDEIDKWQKFTTDEAIGWINLHQSAVATDVRKEFNIKSTPQLFLLNEKKEVLYKNIDPAQLTDLIAEQLK
jgi:peroxiredoxin